MGYVEQSLMPSEQVVLKAKLHWAIFVGPAIVTGVGFLLVIASSAGSEDIRAGIGCFAWLLFLLGLMYLASAAVSYLTTEFAVTDKRHYSQNRVASPPLFGVAVEQS